MNKLNLLMVGTAAVVLGGCFAAPQMRMTAPEDSDTYNGIAVKLHSINDGDFGNSTSSAEDSASVGNLADLLVDSLPQLEYRIGPLDMVQVVVWEHPELTSPMGQYQPAGQKVTTEGKLFYPYAGELQAAGLTAQELRAEITKRLSDKILNDPQVDVRVTGYNSLKAFVSGAVNRPGHVSFDEKPMTLPLMLAAAGGFNEGADPAKVQIRRGNKIYDINYLDAFKSNLPLDRILMKPGDQVFVPALAETQKENRVYVMGEVQKVGIVNVNQGKLTLVEALATAGGLQAMNASASSIYVIRNTSESQIDVFHLDSKNAMALALADRFNLKARDIVYVDASSIATWNRLVTLILPTAQLIYHTANTARNVQLISNDGWGEH